jgi:hypothetical protein
MGDDLFLARLEARAEALAFFCLSLLDSPVSDNDLSFVEIYANAIISGALLAGPVPDPLTDVSVYPILDHARLHIATATLGRRAVAQPAMQRLIGALVEDSIWLGSAVGTVGVRGAFIDIEWRSLVGTVFEEYWEYLEWLFSKLMGALGLDFLVGLVDATEYKGVLKAIANAVKKADKQSVDKAAKAVARAMKKAAAAAKKAGEGKAAKAVAKAATSTAAVAAFLAWFIFDVLWELGELLWDYFTDQPIGDNPVFKAMTK